MILRESTKYDDEYLNNLIKDCSLKNNAKNLLIHFTNEISVYLVEIYHQINRQPLPLDVYKNLQEMDNEFAKVIITCTEQRNLTKQDIIKLLTEFTTKLNSFLSELSDLAMGNTKKQLNNCYDCIVKEIKLFIPKCNCIVANLKAEDSIVKQSLLFNQPQSLSSLMDTQNNNDHNINNQSNNKPTITKNVRTHIVHPSSYHNRYRRNNTKY